VESSEAVLARIRFRAPQQTTQLSFSATAVISGDNWPAPVPIPVTATIAGISIFLPRGQRRLTIAQGGKATAQLVVRALGKPETVEFVMFATPQGIGIEGGSARTSLINAGQTVSFDLTFEASPDAPLGVHELQGLAFRTLDRQVQRNLDHLLSFDVR